MRAQNIGLPHCTTVASEVLWPFLSCGSMRPWLIEMGFKGLHFTVLGMFDGLVGLVVGLVPAMPRAGQGLEWGMGMGVSQSLILSPEICMQSVSPCSPWLLGACGSQRLPLGGSWTPLTHLAPSLHLLSSGWLYQPSLQTAWTCSPLQTPECPKKTLLSVGVMGILMLPTR